MIFRSLSERGTNRVRILLVDDHAILRRSLRMLINAEPGLEVVAEASNGGEAVDVAMETRPDVVLMDLDMPELNGIESTRQIHRALPATRVIVLTCLGDLDHARDAIRAGATGYVLKRADIEELSLAIQTVLRGNFYLSQDLAEVFDLTDAVLGGPSTTAAPGGDVLTDRERQVLQLTAEGHSSRLIAVRIGVSPRTVEGHRARAMVKLGCHTRTDLIRAAQRRGLVA